MHARTHACLHTLPCTVSGYTQCSQIVRRSIRAASCSGGSCILHPGPSASYVLGSRLSTERAHLPRMFSRNGAVNTRTQRMCAACCCIKVAISMFTKFVSSCLLVVSALCLKPVDKDVLLTCLVWFVTFLLSHLAVGSVEVGVRTRFCSLNG